MKIAVFDCHEFEKEYLNLYCPKGVQLDFIAVRLSAATKDLALNYSAICVFVNDKLNSETLKYLATHGLKCIALRCAGFNNVDISICKDLGIKVVRVPEYSPHAVAEHALAMLLSLNRKIHKAYNRVRDFNFSLEHLVGFDIYGKTVGVIGTGKIGSCFAEILLGMGAKVLGVDVKQNPKLLQNKNFSYVELDTLVKKSDIISLHLPLNLDTKYLLDHDKFKSMKDGVYIVNTSRGALIHTKALIDNLKTGKIGAAALDVYEEEEHSFFEDHSFEVIQDDMLARLVSFPNVLVTSHQAFLTKEALENIAKTTMENLAAFKNKKDLQFEL